MGGNGGGGIENLGMLTLADSTVSGNSATGTANGFGRGGGIENFSGTLTVTNSTISGNTAAAGGLGSAGGGIDNFSGTLTEPRGMADTGLRKVAGWRGLQRTGADYQPPHRVLQPSALLF